jgi:ABC-type microcin C transport system duplicated ATPase subunit YejF
MEDGEIIKNPQAQVHELSSCKENKVFGDEILNVKNLSVIHQLQKSFFKKENFYANKNLNFSLKQGQNLGIIGESGSGKSTIALALTNLISFTGEINFFGEKNWLKNNKELRRDIQIIFQDPFSSLDPRMLVKDIIEEGLLINGRKNQSHEVDVVMKKLHLNLNLKNHYPHQLSGGQRQRVAIARALILNPKILVLDEPTSALDLKTQNEILKLLAEIQKVQKISYILISHDLDVVAQIADQIVVLKSGQIFESGEKSQIILSPKESYTKALISHF